MNIELLYLYIGENNTPIKNIDICFTHEYQIKYENKKLNIDKNEEYQYKNFYGKYIKNYSLIVGKNGSGKTTLLNYLGLMSKNLNKYHNLKNEEMNIFKISRTKFDCNDFGCWFALYTFDDMFYIEGYNYQRLFDQNNLNNLPISLNFSLFIEYDFNTKLMKPVSFASQYTTPDVDFFYYKRLIESNTSEFETQITSNLSNIDNERYTTLRLFRKEITTANINNIYKLFGDYSELLFEKTFAKAAKITIKIKELDYDSTEEFDQNITKIFNKQIQFNLFKNNDSRNAKDAFIANLYYNLAFGLWNAYIRRVKINDLLPQTSNNITESKIIEREIALYYLNAIQKGLKIDINDYVKELDLFTEYLINVDEKYFFNEVKIDIPLTQYDAAIQKVLDYYYKRPAESGLDETIEIKYTNLSSGEHEYIEVFGSLIKMLSEIKSDDMCKNRVLIFDEPDRTFHPEWTSNYISNLTKILNSFGEKRDISFQIIISTHSPFMVSDVLKEDIYKIEIINGKRIIVNSKYGFASNYYDIMKDTFFLTSSVGHFAKDKIHYINIQIENVKTVNELIQNKKNIEAIGDEYLRKILISKYYKKLANLKGLTSKALIKERINEKEQELRNLKKLLKENE